MDREFIMNSEKKIDIGYSFVVNRPMPSNTQCSLASPFISAPNRRAPLVTCTNKLSHQPFNQNIFCQ